MKLPKIIHKQRNGRTSNEHWLRLGAWDLRLTLRGVQELRRNDIAWEPGGDSPFLFSAWLNRAESIPLGDSLAVRSVMFADCNKYHRCPQPDCWAHVSYKFMNTWQYCHECGTLIAPHKYIIINPEYITAKAKMWWDYERPRRLGGESW